MIMEIIKNFIIFIMGTIFGSIWNDIYTWLKSNYKLFKEAKKILNEYKILKECNKKYKEQVKQYNIYYEEWCREYYINQIKEKYGTEYCTPEMLRKYWIDDNNQWKTITTIDGVIHEITSIGLDTLNKNIWKSYGALNIYD